MATGNADDGYAQALRRIRLALASNAGSLNLISLGLTRVPAEIGQLTALTRLYLNGNQLTTVPAEIGQLKALRTLDLRGNQLTAVPAEIGQLTALTELDLGDNQLTAVSAEIGQLTALTELVLAENQLTAVPAEIGQLTTLTELTLHGNRLTAIPAEIGQLTALTRLFLGRNQLTAVPVEIGQLTALRGLYLFDNRLNAVPAEIGQLTALMTLNLDNNQLTAVPAEIGQLTALTRLGLSGNQLGRLPEALQRLSNLRELYLHGNEALRLPPEVLGPTSEDVMGERAKPAAPAAILDYYFRLRKAGKRRALNEVKVILVGQGSVGKTSLVKRIVHGTFNKREKKTEGIYIEKGWSVAGKKGGERVQVNFWDFGGQEIMHATHQFFLTRRTVYLLVLDARKGENESNIHYWLKIIRSYGGDSPVLVVTNKCDAHYLDLNETRLRKDYPAIKGFYQTSCEEGTGIEELKEGIEKQIHGAAMKHVFDPLPEEYFEVKKRLEERARAENYIDIREYYALCVKHGVTASGEQDGLLRFLHDLGSVLSFNDPGSPYALREMSVLNPDWVTKGVYKILNDKALAKESGGVLSAGDLTGILKGRTHPAKCHEFIVGMMHKFELCFTIREQQKWLVAELLPVKEPERLGEWEKALRFEYHYDVLPGGIICRFIVRRYENLTKPPVYWRSGVVLEFDGCRALVRGDTDKGRVYIAVMGPENCRRAFLSVLRDEFRRIHGTIPNLKPKEMVPLRDDPDVVVPYEHLLTLEKQVIRDFIPPGADRRYAVMELLDGIEDPWLRRFGEHHLYPPLFVTEPQNSFADAWEVFCCEVLNRYKKTDEIRRRKAPENGVDLYWPAEKIAYQCKSVEDSLGRFSVTKAVESIRSAKTIRKELPWERYVVCSNVDITGPQETKLKEELPEVELLTPSFWMSRCREQSQYLRERFLRLGPMDRRSIVG